MPDTVSAPRTKLSMEEICARTEALLPGFRARAAETENERKLPKESIDELYDAGLLQLFAPARYGGLELDWPAIVQTSRIAAHGCASTGWMISVVFRLGVPGCSPRGSCMSWRPLGDRDR